MTKKRVKSGGCSKGQGENMNIDTQKILKKSAVHEEPNPLVYEAAAIEVNRGSGQILRSGRLFRQCQSGDRKRLEFQNFYEPEPPYPPAA